MGDHILRRDVVAGDDIARQRDQSRNLFRMKGGKTFDARRLLPAAVLQLNANGGIVNARTAAPVAYPGVPPNPLPAPAARSAVYADNAGAVQELNSGS